MNTRDKTVLGLFGITVVLLLLALFYVYNQTRRLDSKIHQIARQTKLTAKMSDVHYAIDAHVKNQGTDESHAEKRFTAIDHDNNKLNNELENIRKEVRALDSKIAAQLSAQNAIQVAQIAARTAALISPAKEKEKTTFVSDNLKVSVGEPVIVDRGKKHSEHKRSTTSHITKDRRPEHKVEHRVEHKAEHKSDQIDEHVTGHKAEHIVEPKKVKFVEPELSTPSPINIKDDLTSITEEHESDLDSVSSTKQEKEKSEDQNATSIRDPAIVSESEDNL